MLSRIGLVLRVTVAAALHDLRGQIPVTIRRKEEGKREIDLPVEMSSAAINEQELQRENSLPSPEVTHEQK